MNAPAGLINNLTQQPITQAELQSVAQLGDKLVGLEADIETLEATLELRKRQLFEIQTKALPDAMTLVGLNSITLINGPTLEVVPFYQCSLSDEYPDLKQKGLKWLRTNGAGELIKHEFKCALGVEAEKDVASLRGYLNRKSIPFKDGQSVNAAKLKSYMKECLEGAKPFPLDIFRGYAGKIAKIATKK